MIEKIKHTVKKRKSVLTIIFIVLMISISALSQKEHLTNNDELWAFSNIYKMTNGFTIYKDLNVIITPLFFYVGVLIFRVFGANFLILKIYNILIYTIMFILIYKIFQNLHIKANKNILFLFLIYLVAYPTIAGGANYNILAMDLYLLGILLVLRGKDNFIQGIIIFLIFMTKQNIGIYYLIGYSIYLFIQNKNILTTIKKILISLAISTLLFSIYLLFLALNNNLYNFINYTLLGIDEFATKNYSIDASIILYYILIILMYIFMIWIAISKKVTIKEDYRRQEKVLICFSATFLLVTIPIVNEYHFIESLVPTIVTFIILMEKNFLEDIIYSHKVDIIVILVMIMMSAFSIYKLTDNIIKITQYNFYDIYYGANIDDATKNEINEIIDFIKENEEQGYQVKILSNRSNLYMNILKRNNGKIDLPFYGNLGQKGEEGLIKEIQEFKFTKILLSIDDKTSYQESMKVKNFIKENYEKIGEIQGYNIYKVGY